MRFDSNVTFEKKRKEKKKKKKKKKFRNLFQKREFKVDHSFFFFCFFLLMSEFGECPVCNQSFPLRRLPSHVENCLESGASPPSALHSVAANSNTFFSLILFLTFFFFFFFLFVLSSKALSPRFEELQKQRAHCPLCRNDVPALGLGL
jgi:hypothetical protein